MPDGLVLLTDEQRAAAVRAIGLTGGWGCATGAAVVAFAANFAPPTESFWRDRLEERSRVVARLLAVETEVARLRALAAPAGWLAERNTLARELADTRDELDTARAETRQTRQDARDEIRDGLAELTRIMGLFAREQDMPDDLDMGAVVEHVLVTRRTARAQVERARALHTPYSPYSPRGDGEQHCSGCRTPVTFTPWPCPTILALNSEVSTGG
jgi:hypothetical protein